MAAAGPFEGIEAMVRGQGLALSREEIEALVAGGACDEREARRILGNVSRATLFRERAAGRIRAVKIGNRTGWLRASLYRRLAEGLSEGPQG